MRYPFLLQTTRLSERTERAANETNDSSDETDSDSDESDSVSDEDVTTASSDDSDVTTTSMDTIDECALLRDYVDSQLSDIPQSRIVFLGPSALYVRVLNKTVPGLLELLESTPSLFANVSRVIGDTFGRTAEESYTEVAALPPVFVAVANESCGISLSPQQIRNVTLLFEAGVASYLFTAQACDVLNQTSVEAAVAAASAAAADAAAAADGRAVRIALSIELDRSYGVRLLSVRIDFVIGLAFTLDDVTARAQTALDEFLFVVNDFCGIPTLSDVTLAQLRQYYLVDVVNAAMASSP